MSPANQAASSWRQDARPRVLITGGSGFIGCHCLSPLLARGFEVHAVHSQGAPPGCEGVTWHQADLLEAGACRRVVELVRPVALLHLAWFVKPGALITHPDNLKWVIASAELLRAFQECGGRRCVASGSCYEYDWRDGYCREDSTPETPDTLYGSAKNGLRQVWLAYSREQKVSAAWARVFFLYGPREHPGRLVPSIAISLLTGKEAKSSTGEQIRDYLHVQDVADGIVSLLDSSCTGTYNICSGQGIRVREIVEQLGESTGRTDLLRIGAIAARANDAPVVVGDRVRIGEAVGWSPRIALQPGLSATVDWWREHLPAQNP